MVLQTSKMSTFSCLEYRDPIILSLELITRKTESSTAKHYENFKTHNCVSLVLHTVRARIVCHPFSHTETILLNI